MNLTIKNVQKKYGDTEVIKNLDLEIESGELVSLLGPSGCGKSTTLFMISGLEPITSGQIFFGDEDVTNLSADKRDIGLVFQNYALYPHYTVLRNVMFPLLNKKIDKATAEKQAMEVIRAVKLEDHAHKKPGELSGGQQQRVAIARAIVKKPKVLLLDEPLSNLDAELKVKTIMEIREIQKQFGITTIFVTHDQQEALAVSDRIVVLDRGVAQDVGKPNDLYRKPANSYVANFIGSPNINLFESEIIDGKIQGLEELIDGQIKIEDGLYEIGIRPEAFYLDANSKFTIDPTSREILGRDILIYAKIKDVDMRLIIRNISENNLDENNNFKVKLEDVLIFDKETKMRIDHE
ncbi:ABC transporter ATP-binding protein [Mollicutes bacterium LVI A0039]|nr:ABC transporter ATP-binding protein [Mollicutes bacterium LVI A0039]